MSKKHKNRNNGGNNQNNLAAQQPNEDQDLKAMMEATGGDTPETPDENADEPAAEESAPEVSEQEPSGSISTIVPTAEQAPKVEEPKKPEAVNLEPAPEAVTPRRPVIRILPMTKSAPVSTSNKIGLAAVEIQKEVSEQAYLHSTAGRKMMQMFDEYAELCKNTKEDDVRGMNACARKLYDIMTMACPVAGSLQNNNYNELIKIVFKRLSQGYGGLFNEASLFRVSYNLPSPTDSMKFDAFYNAMYQLVECAKSGERIRFNTKTLGVILNSPSAIRTITDIRRRLEAARA